MDKMRRLYRKIFKLKVDIACGKSNIHGIDEFCLKTKGLWDIEASGHVSMIWSGMVTW